MNATAETRAPSVAKADVMPAIKAFILSLGLDYHEFPDDVRNGSDYAFGHSESDTLGIVLRVAGWVSERGDGINFTAYAMQSSLVEEGDIVYMKNLIAPSGEYLYADCSWTTVPVDYWGNPPTKTTIHPDFLDAMKHTFALNLAEHEKKKLAEEKAAALCSEFHAVEDGKFSGENYDGRVFNGGSKAGVQLMITTEDPEKVKAILAILSQ